jgi:hypothetical protein
LQTQSIAVESLQYEQLLELEKRLDEFLLRKRADWFDATKVQQRQRRTLRVFISHSSLEPLENEPPTWDLRIEGRFVDEAPVRRLGQAFLYSKKSMRACCRQGSKARRRFSTLFKSVFVEFEGHQGESKLVEVYSAFSVHYAWTTNNCCICSGIASPRHWSAMALISFVASHKELAHTFI